MCFSPEASFAAAATTAAFGVVAMRRARHPTELPLASLPLLFGVQQAIEGALWLSLPRADLAALSRALTLAFLVFAKVWWPVYTPLAAMLCEPSPNRRALMRVCLVAGAMLSAYLLVGFVSSSQVASLHAGHIRYDTDQAVPLWTFFLYVAIVCAPLLASSYLTIRLFGAIVLAGCAVGAVRYAYEFISVWCFFAAAASVVLVLHFERRRRMAPSASEVRALSASV